MLKPRPKRASLRVSLIVLSVLLLVQGVVALRSGQVAVAGLCLGGFACATITLRSWYRGRAMVLRVPAEPTPSAVKARVLVAIVVPDQIPHLGELLGASDLGEADVTVLAIRPASTAREAGLEGDGDPRLAAEIARAVALAKRPVGLMRVVGPNPAFVTFAVALRLGASRVVVASDADTSAEVQRQRCALAWEGFLHLVRPSKSRWSPPTLGPRSSSSFERA